MIEGNQTLPFDQNAIFSDGSVECGPLTGASYDEQIKISKDIMKSYGAGEKLDTTYSSVLGALAHLQRMLGMSEMLAHQLPAKPRMSGWKVPGLQSSCAGTTAAREKFKEDKV